MVLIVCFVWSRRRGGTGPEEETRPAPLRPVRGVPEDPQRQVSTRDGPAGGTAVQARSAAPQSVCAESNQTFVTPFQAEYQLQERYFNVLVKKEQLEEKMRGIREMKCRAVTCRKVRDEEGGRGLLKLGV